jgi:hypothetical protein
LEEGDGFLLDLARGGLHPRHKHNMTPALTAISAMPTTTSPTSTQIIRLGAGE